MTPQKEKWIKTLNTIPILLREHFAPSSSNTNSLTARMQPNNIDRRQGLPPQVRWSLKQPKKSPYIVSTHATCYTPIKVFESPFPCNRAHTPILFD